MRNFALLPVLLLVACAATPPAPEPEKTEPEKPAPDPTVFALFDGKSGDAAEMAALVAASKDADLIAFGEIHRSPAGSAVQLQLLEALADQPRPLALAMEFFERDTQGVLDRYLLGEVAEKDFKKWARQSKGYVASHQPLIEFCKREGIPVIAANAPRRLATEFRKSKSDYPAFLESITDAERSYLPRAWSDMTEAEEERFFAAMGGHATPETKDFTRSMSLWDDAMAEACADMRTADPDRRVLLIVGAFHVMRGAQTARKFRERRPDDTTLVLAARIQQSEPFAFEEGDAEMGEFVLKVHAPPKPKLKLKPGVKHPPMPAKKPIKK